jgi:hypothetical protein
MLVIGRECVARQELSTIAAYVSADILEKIKMFQRQEAKKKNPWSRSEVLGKAVLDYMNDESRSFSAEEFQGSCQVLAYVSAETKEWMKSFCQEIDRTESWVAGKAIAVFLRSRGL